MHVFHLVDSMERGGMERMVCDLAVAQQAAGHEVCIVCMHSLGPYAAEARAAGVAVEWLHKRPGLDLGFAWRLARKVRASRRHGGPAVLHSHNAMPGYYAALAGLMMARAIQVNTRHNMGSPRPGDRIERLFKWSVKALDAVVFVSEQSRQKFVEGGVVPRYRAALVKNGVPLGRYPPASASSRSTARARLGLPNDAFVVGAVGRLVEVKNHRLLVRAARAVLAALPGARFVLVGGGELHDKIKAEVQSLGMADSFLLAGERDDVPALLPALDTFVLCSLSEGYSISLVEAAAVGLAVVASRVGGNPEIIQHGVSGLIVESGDAEGLAAALLQLAADPAMRRSLGAAAASWAREHASVEAMERQYAAIYSGSRHG